MGQRVFVVVGAKGGAGATLLAVNLMESLPTLGERVIVDADLTGKRSLGVWFDVTADLDVGRVAGAAATARSNAGPTIMELTRSYEDSFIQTAAAVSETINGLPGDALIVVDAPQPFAGTVRPFIARASKIIVVTEPTLLGTSAALVMLAALERFGIPPNLIALVVNEGRSKSNVSRSDIAGTLKVPMTVHLPELRDRNFRKIFGDFVDALSASPDPGPLENLRQSTAKPIGEPRVSHAESSGERRPDGAERRRQGEARNGRPDAQTAAAVDVLKAELHAQILTRIDFLAAARADTDVAKLAQLRDQVDRLAAEFLASRSDVTSAEESSRIRREVIEEALGYGPLESLLQEEDITEIMVNGYANIFVERHGRLQQTSKRFVDDRQVRLVIERIIAPLGRRLDESSPMVDARLPDGSRVNAIIEPLAIDGPSLTIRRFGTRRMDINDLLRVGAVTEPIVDFLRAAVVSRMNILVSGGTGSGKTTLLNSLSDFIPADERIVTIEDAAELRLNQPHVVRLESRPPNLEGKGAITIRELVRNSLRMRPDRIVVGECRGGEALDMLQAMNTGHDGSLTTAHANTPRDALARIETMVLMSGYDLPVRAIREQIAGAINLIVQVARLRDGSRRVISLSEVVGMEGNVVTMQELVRYDLRGRSDEKVLGEFVPTGVQPACLHRFKEHGIAYDPSLFSMSQNGAQVAWLR